MPIMSIALRYGPPKGGDRSESSGKDAILTVVIIKAGHRSVIYED